MRHRDCCVSNIANLVGSPHDFASEGTGRMMIAHTHRHSARNHLALYGHRSAVEASGLYDMGEEYRRLLHINVMGRAE